MHRSRNRVLFNKVNENGSLSGRHFLAHSHYNPSRSVGSYPRVAPDCQNLYCRQSDRHLNYSACPFILLWDDPDEYITSVADADRFDTDIADSGPEQ